MTLNVDCAAINKNGHACKSVRSGNSEYCFLHNPHRAIQKCRAKNQTGGACANFAMAGEKLCGAHGTNTEKPIAIRRMPVTVADWSEQIKEEVINIQDSEGLRDFINRLIKEVRLGYVPAPVAGTLKGLLELLRDVIKDIKPTEDPNKYRARMMVIMSDNMSLEDAWKLIQDPSKEMQKLADKAMMDYNPSEGVIDLELLETTKEKVLETIDSSLNISQEDVQEIMVKRLS